MTVRQQNFVDGVLATPGAAAADVVAELTEIKAEYERHRAIFVGGERMSRLLRGLGASDSDLAALQRASTDLPDDPTLPFRKARNGRYFFDNRAGRIDRLEFQPFVLSADEDFVRYDSGQIRQFAEIGADLQSNRALQGLLRFKAFVVDGLDIAHRPKLDYGSANWVCTLFHLRTVTTPALTGEPALEGVHSDGVDHTMTTMLGAENMTDDSARTFIHDMRETNAIGWDEVDPALRIGQYQHRRFLDTLLVVDHEFKHSLSPVLAADTSRVATRDMLVFFTRKPTVPGHVSHRHDSLRRHATLPLSVPPVRGALSEEP
ncbi:2OG-Fe dioxygenase family protein [Nocardia sp. NPDC050697]|uniref:2OG-Fe dioxygenase family protein n=1 Tax=Nocardia sp. NPDC050697 TaxID=3155158 RepID=UPI0033ED4BEE